jgi:iron complex outermembrane recepter protein
MRRVSAQLLAATMLAGTGSALPAFAQTAEEAEASSARETIRVTGSRIQRQDITGLGPATVLDRAQIDNSGVMAVEQLLDRLPSTAGFAGNQTNAYWTSNGYGTTQVNLRGLGVNRTLVLLNGRRVVSGGTGANNSVDLSVIPVAVIDRLEVLKDGASAIYGADAVAGVVNIITREFEGFQTSGRYGITQEGDGAEYNLDAIWGIASDRGSLNASISWQKTEAVNMADRAPCSLAETNGALECFGSSATIGGRALLADGTRINFSQPGAPAGAFAPFDPAVHNFASFPYLNAVNPIERVSFTSFGRLNLTDNVDLFTEFLYTNRQSTQLASPGSLTNIAIAADHPTNPTGASSSAARATSSRKWTPGAWSAGWTARSPMAGRGRSLPITGATRAWTGRPTSPTGRGSRRRWTVRSARTRRAPRSRAGIISATAISAMRRSTTSSSRCAAPAATSRPA